MTETPPLLPDQDAILIPLYLTKDNGFGEVPAVACKL